MYVVIVVCLFGPRALRDMLIFVASLSVSPLALHIHM